MKLIKFENSDVKNWSESKIGEKKNYKNKFIYI